MRTALVLLAALAAAVAAASVSGPGAAAPGLAASSAQLSGPPSEQVLFGHAKSLARKGGRWEMRFDPALWLGGTAAEQAAVQDGFIQPGEPVPNDYYIVDEGHRLLTYTVRANARVTILTQGPKSTLITVPELAQILKGKNPKHRRLYDPGNHLGYWIRVTPKYPNPVRALDQQYQP